MSKYVYSETWNVSVKTDTILSVEVDPEDFLYCENEDELKDALAENLYEDLYALEDRFVGDEIYFDDLAEISLDPEFYKEWKQLKESQE